MPKKAIIASQHPTNTPTIPGGITVEDIRKIPRFKDISDAEAQRMLLTLRAYCSLLADFFTQNENQND